MNPAMVYLSSLAPSGRRSMAQVLNVVAEILGGANVGAFLWHSMRYEHAYLARQVLTARYAPATANKALCALRGVAREAWRLGLIDAETHARIRDVPGVFFRRLLAAREVPIRDLARLFRACAEAGASGVRDAASLALLYGCGLLRSEAVSLDISAFDGALVRVVGRFNRERVVPVPTAAAAALRAWIELRGGEPGPLLCPVRAGAVTLRRMGDQCLATALRRRSKEAGLKRPVSPNDLRRTYVSGLLRAGGDITLVQKLIGHVNPQTTSRYDERGEVEKADAVSRLVVPFVLRVAPVPAGVH